MPGNFQTDSSRKAQITAKALTTPTKFNMANKAIGPLHNMESIQNSMKTTADAFAKSNAEIDFSMRKAYLEVLQKMDRSQLDRALDEAAEEDELRFKSADKAAKSPSQAIGDAFCYAPDDVKAERLSHLLANPVNESDIMPYKEARDTLEQKLAKLKQDAVVSAQQNEKNAEDALNIMGDVITEILKIFKSPSSDHDERAGSVALLEENLNEMKTLIKSGPAGQRKAAESHYELTSETVANMAAVIQEFYTKHWNAHMQSKSRDRMRFGLMRVEHADNMKKLQLTVKSLETANKELIAKHESLKKQLEEKAKALAEGNIQGKKIEQLEAEKKDLAARLAEVEKSLAAAEAARDALQKEAARQKTFTTNLEAALNAFREL